MGHLLRPPSSEVGRIDAVPRRHGRRPSQTARPRCRRPHSSWRRVATTPRGPTTPRIRKGARAEFLERIRQWSKFLARTSEGTSSSRKAPARGEAPRGSEPNEALKRVATGLRYREGRPGAAPGALRAARAELDRAPAVLLPSGVAELSRRAPPNSPRNNMRSAPSGRRAPTVGRSQTQLASDRPSDSPRDHMLRKHMRKTHMLIRLAIRIRPQCAYRRSSPNSAGARLPVRFASRP
jgi:hypothetical protein